MPAFFSQSSKLCWKALFRIANSFCFNFSIIFSIVEKRFLFIGVFSLGKRKKSAEANFGEYSQASVCEMVRYHGAKTMIGFSTILCASGKLLRVSGSQLRGSISHWLYELVTRNYDAPCHCNRKKRKCFTFNRTCRAFFHWNYWVLVSMSQLYAHDSSPVMTFLSKSESSLNVVNISWAISMRRCLPSKFSNFGTIFAAARFMPKITIKIAWHDTNNMPTSETTSLIVTFSSLLQCRSTRTSIVIDIFSAFLTPVILQLNLCSAHSRLVKCSSQHFKYSCALLISFFTQTVIQFLWSNCKKSKSTPKHD